MQTFINDHFSLLLKTSGQGAVLILLVLLAQWLFARQLKPRWRYALWLLVAVRLALPWTISSPASLFNVLNFSSARAKWMPQFGPHSGGVQPPEAASAEQNAEASAPDTAATTPSTDLTIRWLLCLWAAGVLTLAISLLISHFRLAARISRRRPLIDAAVLNLLEDCKQLMAVRAPVTLVETAEVGSPTLFGFVRPRLLLPAGFTRDFSHDELRYVFLHELAHIKRNDILVGWLMTALQILHWFNPLVWFAYHRMRVDRELACDALALSFARDEENENYGQTIIKLLENFGRSAWAPSMAGAVENKNQLKERIRMIAKYRKTNRAPALAAFIIIILGLLTLTDAQPGDKPTADTTADKSGPPKIVTTSPAVGATDVDPALTEITVTFDQDMGRGMSWTGGGPVFPSTPEDKKAHWRNKRTCILPVKLEAGHLYRVGINSTSYQNFRAAAGMAAPPAAIYFTTEGASPELKAKVLPPKVVSLNPANGAQDVNPALAELRVTFNVPMGGGCSWCTVSDDGSDYPGEVEGKHFHWTKDRKTGVLPVKLKPGMTYRLKLNDVEFKNFQSDAGVPLEPVTYTFKTSDK